jgi:hypothetical protein
VNLAQNSGSCTILELELGPLDLNLLRLEVHLDEVVLVITANPAGGPTQPTAWRARVVIEGQLREPLGFVGNTRGGGSTGSLPRFASRSARTAGSSSRAFPPRESCVLASLASILQGVRSTAVGCPFPHDRRQGPQPGPHVSAS